MNKAVVCLYPEFGVSELLQGLYLRRDLLADEVSRHPFVYANFLTSLDGRIAWRNPQEEHYQLPAILKSDEDFRLFLELYAHADCIITHGGYMRALSAGRLGNVLQIPRLESTQDLYDWRKNKGLSPTPDVVIVSGSLDFPWHDSLDATQQRVHIATGGCPKEECKEQWAKKGHDIHVLGAGVHVDANPLMEFIGNQGYRSVYLVAGPQLLQELLLHGYIDRFFMTMRHQLLGGNDFKSLIPEYKLGKKGCMRLQRLYMDDVNSNMPGQWYAEFSINSS